MVIDALITTRILVQFIGQIVARDVAAAAAPDMPRPYRMWLYPLPNLVALFGLGLPLRHVRPRRHPVRPRNAVARDWRVRRLGAAHRAVAVRG